MKIDPRHCNMIPAIGMRCVLGGAAFITSDADMFNKLRKAAADLGADAVMREAPSHAAIMSGPAFHKQPGVLTEE